MASLRGESRMPESYVRIVWVLSSGAPQNRLIATAGKTTQARYTIKRD
jgi:hypothetical protein